MKKVIVVGAGIAGMSAGIYALQSGFDVTILEQHTLPGGNCTSWKRKGYLFEGGLHWLTGSNQNQPIHKLWREVGALAGDSHIQYSDPFITCEYNGEYVSLYRDLEKFKAHLCSVSPEDTSKIQRLCKDIKAFSALKMPMTNIRGLKIRQKEKSPSMFSVLPKMLPAILRMGALSKLSIKEYVQQFKHPAIRLLLSHVAGDEYFVPALIFSTACFTSGDGGYPEGGSLKMAMNMAKRFTELGGNIKYGTRVERILIKDGKATGLATADTQITADAVIITSDTLSAIDKLFETPLHEPWADSMRKNTKLTTCTFMCLGVEVDLSHLPESVIYPLDQPIVFAGGQITSLSFNNYANYQGYAPNGCTALTFVFDGNYDYWKAARADGSYAQKKQALAEEVIRRLEEKLPAVMGKVAVWDVATPLTYERYCGTYQGSWMTLQAPGCKQVTYPSKPESIDRLYFAGQRVLPPGGLPVALITGRQAVQYLCRDYKTVFQGEL